MFTSRFGLIAAVFSALLISHSAAQLVYEPYAFVTVAGNARYGARDGVGSEARFDTIRVMTTDTAANVYAVDGRTPAGLRVRKITPDAVVTTLAGGLTKGNADGFGRAASFGSIDDIYGGPDGNVYVLETSATQDATRLVRRIRPSGEVTTEFRINSSGQYQRGLAIDAATNFYYFNDNALIQRTTSGAVVKLADVQPGRMRVMDIVVDPGKHVFVTDSSVVYKLLPSGTFSIFAGGGRSYDGLGTNASFHYLLAAAVDSEGSIYLADGFVGSPPGSKEGRPVRKVTADGVVTTLDEFTPLLGNLSEGSFYVCTACGFDDPLAIAVDSHGNLFAGARNNTILRSTPERQVTVFAGMAGGTGSVDGIGVSARFGAWFKSAPLGIVAVTVDANGDAYVTDTSGVRKITPSRVVSTVTRQIASGWSRNTGITLSPNGDLLLSGHSSVVKLDSAGALTTLADFPRGSGFGLIGIVADKMNNIYVLDADFRVIRRLLQNGTNWVANDLRIVNASGTVLTDYARAATALALDPAGNLIVAVGPAIQKLTPVNTNWVASIIAGAETEPGAKDGVGPEARFQWGIYGLAVDARGNIYVSDTANNLIRKVTPGGVVTTLAGSLRPGTDDGIGAAVGFDGPYGLAVDAAGNLYVGDYRNHTFRKGFPAAFLSGANGELSFTNNTFRFAFNAQTNQVAVIEASTNLTHWVSISTNTAGGQISVIDTNAHEPRQFYRVAFPP